VCVYCTSVLSNQSDSELMTATLYISFCPCKRYMQLKSTFITQHITTLHYTLLISHNGNAECCAIISANIIHQITY